MEVTVAGGRAVKLRGAADMPFTNGALCTKVAHYLERVYSDQRLLHPMKRVGRKGEGRFERISWDEALDTIAAKYREIAAQSSVVAAKLRERNAVVERFEEHRRRYVELTSAPESARIPPMPRR